MELAHVAFCTTLTFCLSHVCFHAGGRQEQHLVSGRPQPPTLTHGWPRLGWDGGAVLSTGTTCTFLTVITSVRTWSTGPRPQAEGVLRGEEHTEMLA